MLTQEQLDKLEQDITAAVDAHLAIGGRLMSGGFHSRDGAMCPITCLTGPTPDIGYETIITEKVGIPFTYNDLFEFVRGFDELPSIDIDPKLYALGQKLRQKYLPTDKVA